MKKILAFIVSSSLALSLAACSNQSTTAEKTTADEVTEEVSEEA